MPIWKRGGAVAKRPQGRDLPSLDGLRALAIAIVCLSHMADSSGLNGAAWRFQRSLAIGGLGVRIFFVLSGFLITTLLVREFDRSGTLNLRRFYLRRTLRIFPAYYAFLLFVVGVTALGLYRFHYQDGLAPFTYTTDYFFPQPTTFGHTWSLAVEEQFYLLWPITFLLLGMRRAPRFAVAIMLLCPVWRFVDATVRFHLGLYYPVAAETRFDLTADALATGCALALGRQWLHQWPVYQRLLASRLTVLLPFLCLLLEEVSIRATSGLPYDVNALLIVSLLNLTIAVGLDRVLTYPTGIAGWFLNWRPVVFIGVLSYSIYIWQEIFLIPVRPDWFTREPDNIILTLACALASYVLIERPFLRLRSYLDRRWFGDRRPAPATVSVPATAVAAVEA